MEQKPMKKQTALAAGLKAIATATPGTATAVTSPSVDSGSQVPAKSTVLIGGHFPPQVRRTLLLIQAEQGNEGKNLKILLGEAINLLAAKYGKPQPYAEGA
jgi:hypothetical protein